MNKRQGLTALAAFTRVGMCIVTPVTTVSAQSWDIEVVEDGKLFSNMTDRSLRLDDSDLPHIACGQDHLYYASCDGANWQYEVADPSTNVGQYASLALDLSGYPRISYYDATNGDLKYAYRDASGWHAQVLDSEGQAGMYTSLALDASGYPHISYYDYTNGDLKYAYEDATGWHVQTIDSPGLVGWHTSLALDSSGFPHISYYDGTKGSLKHAYRDASGWHDQTVDVATMDVTFLTVGTSIAVDELGYPHVSYHGKTTLRYARKNATGWHIEIVDSLGASIHTYTSLELDSSGYPHISYYDAWYADLRYAYKDMDGWHLETVWETGLVGKHASLELDSFGYPHICFQDCGEDGMQYSVGYAYKNAAGWHIETGPYDNVQAGMSLGLDGADYPHISYHQYSVKDLKYQFKDASGWHRQTVDSQGSVGKYNSIEVDGAGYPRISYSDFQDGLQYAYLNVSGWHIQTVDSDWGYENSLALDPSGHPHIAYGGQDGLRYAFHNETGWHLQTVDTPYEFPSLALDSSGYPYISYFDETESALKCAHMIPAVIGLSGEIIAGEAQLTWSPVEDASAYWVYGASNLPWFTPGMVPWYEHRLTVLPATTTTWSTSNGVGDPEANWTYLVIAVNASNLMLAISNRVGEQDYSCDIP